MSNEDWGDWEKVIRFADMGASKCLMRIDQTPKKKRNSRVRGRFAIFRLLWRMRSYAALMRYTADNSGRKGQVAYVDLPAPFFPGRFAVQVEDRGALWIRQLANRRFNFQSRDSPVDLSARNKWRSWRFGRFTGNAYLQCPRISGVPRELKLNMICSRAQLLRSLSFGSMIRSTSWPAALLGEPIPGTDCDSPMNRIRLFRKNSMQPPRRSRIARLTTVRMENFPRYRRRRHLGGKDS